MSGRSFACYPAASMHRWIAAVFALSLVATLAIVITEGGPKKKTPTSADAGADAGAAALHATDASADLSDAEAPSDDPLAGSDLNTLTSDAGITLLNGQPAPPLAGDAPKSVVFGVVLVQYKGAQLAPVNSRSREQALELAKDIAQLAKTDFKAAVAKGDKSGSMENAGRMPRGMMEPAPEYVLFSLPKDGVSEPVDTPRGFLIMRRIE